MGIKKSSVVYLGRCFYGLSKFESQRAPRTAVPATEQMGRVHTSAASVVVMPEVEDVAIDIIRPT